MPQIPKIFQQSFDKAIIDPCFQPLTTRFYNQSFERSMFPSLYANLIEGTLAEKLEALIGIQDLLAKNPTLLAYTPKTTLLIKVTIILKEKQFPQHVFEAIRLINQLINNQTNALLFIQAGAFVMLMDVMTQSSHNLLMMSAIWTCCKINFYENNNYRYNYEKDFEKENLVNKAIQRYNEEGEESIDEFIQICSKFDQTHGYVMPKHFSLISDVILEHIIKAKIKDQICIYKAFQYIKRNSGHNHLSQIIENKDYTEYEELLQKLSDFPPQIMVHYVEFICYSIQSRKYPKLTYFFYSRESSITIFQPLFQSIYNLQIQLFLNYLIAIFKCQKKNVINYFKKKPEMATKVLQLIIKKIQERDFQGYGNFRRGGQRASSNSNVLCRALQLSYYLLVNDFLRYWPTYKKYEYLKITLDIVMIESQWSIAYEVFANQLYMLNNLDKEQFESQFGQLDKKKLRSILKKLQHRPEIEKELKFLQEYLDSSSE